MTPSHVRYQAAPQPVTFDIQLCRADRKGPKPLIPQSSSRSHSYPDPRYQGTTWIAPDTPCSHHTLLPSILASGVGHETVSLAQAIWWRSIRGNDALELASRFGVNRCTVALHLTRREVTIRRGRFDPSLVHEAADLYLSGLTLVEVGAKVGAGPQAVRRALASHGVVIRPGGSRRSRITASAAVGG